MKRQTIIRTSLNRLTGAEGFLVEHENGVVLRWRLVPNGRWTTEEIDRIQPMLDAWEGR